MPETRIVHFRVGKEDRGDGAREKGNLKNEAFKLFQIGKSS